jgi:hypothetical protein
MTWADALGYLAALLVLATFSMKTMLPLRLTGIASNLVFVACGYFTSATPVVVLHLILLPLNSLRLYEMWQLVEKVQDASRAAQAFSFAGYERSRSHARRPMPQPCTRAERQTHARQCGPGMLRPRLEERFNQAMRMRKCL